MSQLTFEGVGAGCSFDQQADKCGALKVLITYSDLIAQLPVNVNNMRRECSKGGKF